MNNTSLCMRGDLCLEEIVYYTPPPPPQKMYMLYVKSVHINLEFILILVVLGILIFKLLYLMYFKHVKQESNNVEVIEV